MVFLKVGQPACSTALLDCFVPAAFPYWQVTFLMPTRRALSFLLWPAIILICLANLAIVQAQGAKQRVPENPIADPDADHSKSVANGPFADG
jgi:hypothetical protein